MDRKRKSKALLTSSSMTKIRLPELEKARLQQLMRQKRVAKGLTPAVNSRLKITRPKLSDDKFFQVRDISEENDVAQVFLPDIVIHDSLVIHSAKIQQMYPHEIEHRTNRAEKLQDTLNLDKISSNKSQYSIHRNKLEMTQLTREAGVQRSTSQTRPGRYSITERPDLPFRQRVHLLAGDAIPEKESKSLPFRQRLLADDTIPESEPVSKANLRPKLYLYQRMQQQDTPEKEKRTKKPRVPCVRNLTAAAQAQHAQQSSADGQIFDSKHRLRPTRINPSFIEIHRRELQEDEIKTKLRLVIPKEICSIIKASNGVEVANPELAISYKYYLGPGNNKTLIKHSLDTRSWWWRTDTVENANFIWMQQTDKAVFNKSLHIPATTKPIALPFYNMPRRHIEEELRRLKVTLISKSDCFKTRRSTTEIQPSSLKVYNRLPKNHNLSNKKTLFKNMKRYLDYLDQNPFEYMPVTYHIHSEYDVAFKDFAEENKGVENWIIKPGENTNRGNGIEVWKTVQDVENLLPKYTSQNHTVIVQKYIENPLLIAGRKFDIRCYALVTSTNGNRQAYFYKEGYIRTSCREFSLENLSDKFIHLTNDAVQQKASDYGKYETGNKMNYSAFQKWLDQEHKGQSLENHLLPQIQNIVVDTIKAVYDHLDPEDLTHNFELFGYDFMVDENFWVWLIEVNTNPCLETGCIQLVRVIPHLINNVLNIALDPYFPMPYSKSYTQYQISENKFELIFNEDKDSVTKVNWESDSDSEEL